MVFMGEKSNFDKCAITYKSQKFEIQWDIVIMSCKLDKKRNLNKNSLIKGIRGILMNKQHE